MARRRRSALAFRRTRHAAESRRRFDSAHAGMDEDRTGTKQLWCKARRRQLRPVRRANGVDE